MLWRYGSDIVSILSRSRGDMVARLCRCCGDLHPPFTTSAPVHWERNSNVAVKLPYMDASSTYSKIQSAIEALVSLSFSLALSLSLSLSLSAYVWNYLREFGAQTILYLCPCALCGVAKRGFGIGTCRRSLCSNATSLEVYRATPQPSRV